MADKEDCVDHESSDEDFESADEGEIAEHENEQEKKANELETTDNSESYTAEKALENLPDSCTDKENENSSNAVPRLTTLSKAKIDTSRNLMNSSRDKVIDHEDQSCLNEKCQAVSEESQNDDSEDIDSSNRDDISKADVNISCLPKSASEKETSHEETALEESDDKSTVLQDDDIKITEPNDSQLPEKQPPKQDFQSLFSGWGWSETPSAPTTTPTDETKSDKGDESWGWGSWGNVLSQATASLSTVIESVEATLGVPDPGKLAHHVKDEEDEIKSSRNGETNHESKDPSQDENSPPGKAQGLFSSLGVSTLTSVVQNKGKELMSGGLDALEFLGKKTMDVISEGDPALRKKREAIGGKGLTLSQILREAKQETEQKAASQVLSEDNNLVCFSTEFDEFQGLAHLEALEMLSHQSEAKVESVLIGMSGNNLDIAKYRLRTMQEAGELSEDFDEEEDKPQPDFAAEVTENLMTLNIGCVPDKLTRVDANAWKWLESCVKEQDEQPGSKDAQEIYTQSISVLAELTARGVEQFHKIAELVLLQDPSESNIDCVTLTKSIKKLTEIICHELSTFSSHYAGCLNTAADDSENPELINPLITSVYLEASNSSSYIQDAYKLVLPVLQLAVLKKLELEET